jgi:hypothetical protein
MLRYAEGGYKLITHICLRGVIYGELWSETKEVLEELVLF